jgi:hypothetical protein
MRSGELPIDQGFPHATLWTGADSGGHKACPFRKIFVSHCRGGVYPMHIKLTRKRPVAQPLVGVLGVETTTPSQEKNAHKGVLGVETTTPSQEKNAHKGLSHNSPRQYISHLRGRLYHPIGSIKLKPVSPLLYNRACLQQLPKQWGTARPHAAAAKILMVWS